MGSVRKEEDLSNSISFERCPASTSIRILTYIIVQQKLDVGVLPCTLKPDFNTFASQYPRVQNIFNVSVFVSVPHKILIKLQILEIGSGTEAGRRLKEKGTVYVFRSPLFISNSAQALAA